VSESSPGPAERAADGHDLVLLALGDEHRHVQRLQAGVKSSV